MKDIKVLGPGCNNCKVLEQRVNEALLEAGVEATVTKVEDPMEIVAFGVLSTPGLVVDGALISSGRVPSVRALVELLG
jgi:small redox-active disulfide protein 2